MIHRVGASVVLGRPDPALVAAALAQAGDALDLRVAAPLDDAWQRAGFVEVAPGELVRPLEQRLTGVAATEALGRQLAGLLTAGDLVVLAGPLGAGKTALTRGIAAGLGVTGAVTSPTFVLARVHRGPIPLVHVDAYRLRDSAVHSSVQASVDPSADPSVDPSVDLDDLDLDAALADSVVVVEWGEGLVDALADARLVVRLDRPDSADDDLRTATVIPRGRRWCLLGPAHPV